MAAGPFIHFPSFSVTRNFSSSIAQTADPRDAFRDKDERAPHAVALDDA